MEAADGDPLRASKIERELCGLWYQRHKAWRSVYADYEERERRRAQRK